MIKYYSTLNDCLYDTEKEAETAEDKVVELYFKDLSERAERIRRARNQVVDKNREFKTRHIKIS